MPGLMPGSWPRGAVGAAGYERWPECTPAAAQRSAGQVWRSRWRQRVLDLGGRALAGLDRAVHVAAPLGRGLGARPVQQAGRAAQRRPELGPGARREVRAVAAAGPRVGGPVVLGVVGPPGGGGPEVPGERG